MFKLIEGLPPDVLAIEASGQITFQDYRDTLTPKAEARISPGLSLEGCGVTACSGCDIGMTSATSPW
jgi:hypothetical protein